MNATTIDNDASDNVATRTRSRVRLRAKAREERARLEKARKRLQRIPGHNLESVESSSNSPSYEYLIHREVLVHFYISYLYIYI